MTTNLPAESTTIQTAAIPPFPGTDLPVVETLSAMQSATTNSTTTVSEWLRKIHREGHPRHWVRTILHLNDSPHSIALGTAIGLLIGITPTGGIQMALVLLVALASGWLFRFNRIAALLAVYVSNPLTTIPLCWYSYRIGTMFFSVTLSWAEFKELLTSGLFEEWWPSLQTLFFTVGLPLAIGSVILGTITALIAYPVVYLLVQRIQNARRSQQASVAIPRQVA